MQFKIRLLTALLLCSSSAGFSQSAAAPPLVKIDGKLNEWTAPFQLNKPTKLSYILANDQKNLYLVIKSSDSLFNARILMTGIDFMINTAGKKKEGPFVMFPYIERQPRVRGAGGGAGFNQEVQPLVPVAELVAAHRKIIDQIKEIKLSGFKDITEEHISIYNEYGIKGAASIDDQDNFLYELAIPLNLLGLTADNGQEIALNIKINGSEGQNLRAAGGGGGGFERGGGGGGGFDRGGGGFGGGGGGFERGGGGFGGDGGGRGAGGNGNRPVNLNRIYQATDFWVSYKLTK